MSGLVNKASTGTASTESPTPNHSAIRGARRPVGSGAFGRAGHVTVAVALDVHVERVGAGDDERGAEDRHEGGEMRDDHAGALGHPESAGGGDHAHERDSRLGELSQIAGERAAIRAPLGEGVARELGGLHLRPASRECPGPRQADERGFALARKKE